MAAAFCVNCSGSDPDYGKIVLGTIVPLIPKGSLVAALGLVGAVIMPHNLYLHSSLVLTRKINMNDKNAIKDANIYNTIESSISLFISYVISTAVISTFAVYIAHEPGHTDLSLTDAAKALERVFGKASKYIWGIGLLAAGQSSTMTGTYAGQFVMEGFLNFTLPIWQRVLITRSIAIVPTITVIFLNSEILTEMDTYLNILQAV